MTGAVKVLQPQDRAAVSSSCISETWNPDAPQMFFVLLLYSVPSWSFAFLVLSLLLKCFQPIYFVGTSYTYQLKKKYFYS